jgi:hypothetical protein
MFDQKIVHTSDTTQIRWLLFLLLKSQVWFGVPSRPASDLHVSQWNDEGRVEDLLAFTHTTLHTVQPAAVVLTGRRSSI